MRASIISQRFARASDVYPSQKNQSFKSRKPALDSLSPDSSRTSYEVDAWLHPRTKRTITNSASTTSPLCPGTSKFTTVPRYIRFIQSRAELGNDTFMLGKHNSAFTCTAQYRARCPSTNAASSSLAGTLLFGPIFGRERVPVPTTDDTRTEGFASQLDITCVSRWAADSCYPCKIFSTNEKIFISTD